jgi:S1-C subfamily serine protease
VVSSGGGAPSGSSGHKGYDYSTARVSEQAEIFQVGYGSYVLHCLGSIEDADGEVSNLHLRGLVSPIVVERRTYFLGAGHVFDLRKEMSTLGYSLAASISRPPEYYLERDGRRYDLVRVDTGTRDMALFVAREGQADFPRSRYACGDSDDVRVGNAVLTWGRPLMESFELSAGIVAALAAPPSLRAASFLEAAAEDFFVTSMPTIFGSSGALVYAFRGGEPEIVGMLVAGYVNINRSIVYKINAILRESGLRR